MEPISRSLQGVTGRPDFQKRLEQMKEKVMKDQDVQVFLKEHGDISQSMIERSLNKLYEYAQQSKNCAYCSEDENCNNLLEGYHPKLVVNGRSIDIEYYECPVKRRLDQQKK
ncbi:primosomal protein DnaI, partial [Bacillus atrophaeus]|nr:primosomal protein DnaI [Bacillus atrophaeus]